MTLTLADGPVFAPLGMRLFLPQCWTDSPERLDASGVPLDRRVFKTKAQLALEELDRVLAQGVTFRVVLADAGYGSIVEFRQALTQRELTWAVGIAGHHRAFSINVTLIDGQKYQKGRPRKHPFPSERTRLISEVLDQLPPHLWHTVKGAGKSRWVMLRVRLADGPEVSRGLHLPGEPVWVVGEKRRGGEVRYYVSNHGPRVSKSRVVLDLKARWACETLHTQAKEELGLDHFEGRSLRGLEHHVVLVLLAMLFLQVVRLGFSISSVPVLTLPRARRAASDVLEVVRFGRCPHCGERARWVVRAENTN